MTLPDAIPMLPGEEIASSALRPSRASSGESDDLINEKYARGDVLEQHGDLVGGIRSQVVGTGLQDGIAGLAVVAVGEDVVVAQHEEAVLGAFQKGFKDSDVSVCSTAR